MPPSLLEASNIGRRTADGEWLLQGISLKVEAGDRWAIVGPSGSGKTLLLRALALLDPVEEGTIRWRGEEPSNERVPEFRSDVIYLHQRPVLLEGDVEFNLRRPYQLERRKGREFDRSRIEERLRGLSREASFLARRSDQLSGGEAQMVALLRAIQLQPSVLLLDEPTAALDAESREAIESLVADWLAEPGEERATVWVSHDPSQTGRVADRTLELKQGREVEPSK